MSLYQALIDFRDNENTPMWIRQEDVDDIIRVRTVNKNKRGKSLIMLDFVKDEYIEMFTNVSKDNDHSNNSYLINVALSGYHHDSLFIDTYYFGDEEMKEGYIFRYFSNENLELLKKILKFAAPHLVKNMESEHEEIGKWLLGNFPNEADEICSVYGYEYDETLVKGLRDYITNKFCNSFTAYGIIEKTCSSEYYTTIDNLINFWDRSGADKDVSLIEMFKTFIKNNDLGLDEDLHEDYYAYWDNSNFDQASFDRTVERELTKIMEKIEDQMDEGTLSLNLELHNFMLKAGYTFDRWYNFPSKKTFGEKPKDKFRIESISDGKINIFASVGPFTKKVSKNLEDFKLFLYHPELF